jgi:hypothetical protein
MPTESIGPCSCCGGEVPCNDACLDPDPASASVTLSGFSGDLAYYNGFYTLTEDEFGDLLYVDEGPPGLGILLGVDGCNGAVTVTDLITCVVQMVVSPPYSSGCHNTGTTNPAVNFPSGCGAYADSDWENGEADYVHP